MSIRMKPTKKTNNVTRYDSFKFIEMPDLEDKYYLVSDPEVQFKNPEKVDFQIVKSGKKDNSY